MARKRIAAPAKGEGPSFEEAIARLEEIVRELEEADLPLDKSLAVFEEGVGLSRMLHDKLNAAERKVEVLLKDGAGGLGTAPFGVDAPAACGDDEGDDDAGDVGDVGDDEGDAGKPAAGGGEPGGGGRGSGQTGFGF